MTESHHTLPRILIFDSGVGGLTIAHEVSRLCPTVTIDYLSDNDGFPYGNKSAEVIIQRSLHLLTHMEQKFAYGWDLIIIACNTASTLTLPTLREQLTTPIIGVVPAIKPAAGKSANSYIGLLATPATIKRPYTHKLIRDYASHCTLVSVGSSHLVQLAENKLRGETIDIEEIKKIIQPFQETSESNPTPHLLDTLVLACTHFPLLKEEIQIAFNRPITLIDSGHAIARRTQHLLGLGQEPAPIHKETGCYFYTTKNCDSVSRPGWPHRDFFAASMPVTL